jgi:hypothetical protein
MGKNFQSSAQKQNKSAKQRKNTTPMKSLILFKKTIRPVRKPISLVSAGFLILLLLACLGLAPIAQAVGPDTDGSIPGANNGEGIGVLISRTTGVWNTGTGFEALSQLTAGNQNTATGLRALTSDTNGGFNTATGVYSLFSNTSGFFNSATGAYSLANNISGNYNTTNGYAALYRNTADGNTATGFAALYRNTIGGNNTANGYQALNNNTAGIGNTANGYQALNNNATGDFNTAVGYDALFNNTGSENIALGFFAGLSLTTGNFNIDIGNPGLPADSATIRIGNAQTRTFIAGISGVNEGGTISAVYINTNGQLGTQPPASSRRFKKEIKVMDSASEAILALKPVTFHYKSDATGTPQFGLIAEEVAEVNPDLVVRDENGHIYTVRYDAVNAMLLNEFIKEHRKVEEQERKMSAQSRKAQEQEATIAQLKSTVARQRKDFEATAAQLSATQKEQAAQIHKVSAQLATASPSGGGLEVSKPAPRTVLNK